MSISDPFGKRLKTFTGERNSSTTREAGEDEKFLLGLRVIPAERLEQHLVDLENFFRTHEIQGAKWNPKLVLNRMDRDEVLMEKIVGEIIRVLGPEYGYIHPKTNFTPRGQYSNRDLYKNFETVLKLLVARRQPTLEIKKPE